MKANKPSLRLCGFSLIEMLATIAVIAILTAIALPMIGGYRISMEESKNKRNAQNIVSIYQAAQAANLEFSQSPIDDLETVAKRVAQGGVVPTGIFAGEFFGVKAISESEVIATLPYLDFDPNRKVMVYLSNS